MNPRKNNRRTVNKRLRSQRSAFTLIELLTVISIIGVLTSMVLFALSSVAENARKQRTKAQIAKIHELISGRWESYRTRPMPISVGTRRPELAALLRLKTLNELMRIEMPDRFADVMTGASVRSPLQKVYKTRLELAMADTEKTLVECKPFQSAECLYMILATIQDGDTNGLDFFREREKGDVDGDGMPEILDGWGQPIAFLRWAPGFPGFEDNSFSTLQFGDFAKGADGDAGEGNGDPFDPMKVNPRWSDGVPDNDPFVLFPLIYSLGPDGEPGIHQGESFNSDPYHYYNAPGSTPMDIARGSFRNEEERNFSLDNISNHMLEAR